MNLRRTRTAITLGAIALILAGCGGNRAAPSGDANQAMANISLAGSPSAARNGDLVPHLAVFEIPVGGTAVIAAFRASECGQPAPNFERMMRRQTRDGLRVPNGITLYDAGVGHYTSKRCGSSAQARAVGAQANQPGVYQLPFFDGKATKVVQVR